MATMNEYVRWLAGLPKQNRARAMTGLTIGWSDRQRTDLQHGVALACRETCCCIDCIKAEYRKAGRPLPCAYGAEVCTHAQCQE